MTRERYEMKYGVGVLGSGGMGGLWSKVIASHPDCEVLFMYDPNPDAAEAMAKEIGAQPTTSLEEILDHSDVNLTLICSPTFTHPDLVRQSAASGKHILCEKPMALTLASCQQMIDDCSNAGVTIAVGQSIRFWGAFRKIRELVAEGLIGTPCLAQVHRMGRAGIKRNVPRKPGPQQERRPWRFDTRYAGGNILESVVHELDFTRSILGEVSSAYCEVTGNEPYGDNRSPVVIQAMINFEAGGQATVRQGGIVGFPCKGSWVAGTEGTLSFDVWEGPVLHHHPDLEEPRVLPCDAAYAYDLELLDLLNSIEGDHEPENSGINGMKNIALGLSMYKSIELGKRIEFKDGFPLELPFDYQYRGLNNIKE